MGTISIPRAKNTAVFLPRANRLSDDTFSGKGAFLISRSAVKNIRPKMGCLKKCQLTNILNSKSASMLSEIFG